MLLALVLAVAVPACGGDDGGGGGGAAGSATSAVPRSSSTSRSTTSSSSPTSTTKKPATPEEEVEAAYLKSWDVYAKAVRELDPSGLEEAFAKDALETLKKEVADLKAANTPVRVDVEHDYVISFLDPGKAVVFDAFTNRSVRIDGDTGRPIDDAAPVVRKRAYQLERLEGEWKVVFRRAQE